MFSSVPWCQHENAEEMSTEAENTMDSTSKKNIGWHFGLYSIFPSEYLGIET